VNVIRHDAPGEQAISQAIVMPPILLYDLCQARLAQGTVAVAAIEVGFNLPLLLQFVLKLQESFPLAATRGGHSVGQPIANELLGSRRIEMWQMP
jgi:hypothetical protein